MGIFDFQNPGISRVVKRRNFQLHVQYSIPQFIRSIKFSHPSIVPILNWRFPFPVMPNNKFICKMIHVCLHSCWMGIIHFSYTEFIWLKILPNVSRITFTSSPCSKFKPTIEKFILIWAQGLLADEMTP